MEICVKKNVSQEISLDEFLQHGNICMQIFVRFIVFKLKAKFLFLNNDCFFFLFN